MMKDKDSQFFTQQREKLSKQVNEYILSIQGILDSPLFAGLDQGNFKEDSKSLMNECEVSTFTKNFKDAAPHIFSLAIGGNEGLKTLRDQVYMEEVLKTRSILKFMKKKLEEGGEQSLDLVDFSCAIKMIQEKNSVLKALRLPEPETQEQFITIDIKGTPTRVKIDLAKLKDAIEFEEMTEEELRLISEQEELEAATLASGKALGGQPTE